MDPSRDTVTLHHRRAVPLRAGAAMAVQSPGRCCSVAGCGTRLSRYNPSDTCARHAGWRDEAARRPSR